jgi:phosphonatase-like hydrolase
MLLKDIKMVMFDMSGTTIRDDNEVMLCFKKALADMNISRPDSQLNAMMGWSKIEVFRTIWREEIASLEVAEVRARRTYKIFKEHLENYYAENPVAPTEGALETFEFLHRAGIYVVLDTGFYRKVVDILLQKLNWTEGATVDFTVASDEVPNGRPAPDMIQLAMKHFNINDPKQIIKIGDTPSDLQEGRAARCRYSFGVTNGTHTADELAAHDNDGLFDSMTDFLRFLMGELDLSQVQKPVLIEI